MGCAGWTGGVSVSTGWWVANGSAVLPVCTGKVEGLKQGIWNLVWTWFQDLESRKNRNTDVKKMEKDFVYNLFLRVESMNFLKNEYTCTYNFWSNWKAIAPKDGSWSALGVFQFAYLAFGERSSGSELVLSILQKNLLIEFPKESRIDFMKNGRFIDFTLIDWFSKNNRLVEFRKNYRPIAFIKKIDHSILQKKKNESML